MKLSSWRPTLLVGAIALLIAAGGGYILGQAGNAAASSPSPATVDALDTAIDGGALGSLTATSPNALVPARLGDRVFRRLRLITHAEATLDLPQRGLVTIAVDHGTITSVSASSLVVSESGGATASLALDTRTQVRKGRQKADVAALVQGDPVIAISVKTGSGWTALRVLDLQGLAAAPASPAPQAPSSAPASPAI